MSRCQLAGGPIARCLRQTQLAPPMAAAARPFSCSAQRRDDQLTPSTPPPTKAPDAAAVLSQPQETPKGGAPASADPVGDAIRKKIYPDPMTSTAAWAERILMKKGTPPLGSRRRRRALLMSQNIPFEQLPYQCFQEARKILQADREVKLAEIVRETARLKTLEAKDASELKRGDKSKQVRVRSLRKYIEKLKVQADINDPEVQRRFEDGLGDMSKPIYRHLAEKKWRGYPHRMISQRISQFHIVPDLLPKFEPRYDVQLYFRGRKTEPGEMIDSLVSEKPPSLHVQCFDAGERLVTVAIVDSDVPVPETDGFARRCHFLAANIPLDPTRIVVPLNNLKKERIAIPWLPAFAQKGSPYHRLSIFVLNQKDNQPMSIEELQEAYGKRDGFSIKSLRDKFPLEPMGFTLFRTEWDAHTLDVMTRHGIPGADVELRPKRVYSLREPRKRKGWEAKREGPKYRHLWKYTHRIATPKRKFVR